MASSFYILDGHAQIYRAFYAPFRELTSPQGEPTKATFVFTQMFLNLLRNRRPDYLAMVLDVDDATVFRREIDPNYKAHRDATPDGLDAQMHRIVSIVERMGAPIFRLPGFEADDLMAAMVHRLRDHDVDIFLVSKDKDLEQLMSPRVHMYDPAKDEVINEEWVRTNKGYPPNLAVEIQTLSGDATDNVPGVEGVGTKTAAKLVQKYGSAAAVVAHAHEQTPKLREKLLAFAPLLDQTRRLVTLRRDVPFEFCLDQCLVARIRPQDAAPILQELGFHRLLEQAAAFDDGSKTARPPEALVPDSAENPALLLSSDFVRHGNTQRGDYVLVDTEESLARLAGELLHCGEFAFDTETTGLDTMSGKLVGASFCWRSGSGFYLPVMGTCGPLLPLEKVRSVLGPIFANEGIGKVAQNLKFDSLVLRRAGMPVRGARFDTLLASHLLDPLAASHSLDALARSMLGHEMIPIVDLIGKGKNQITMDQVDTRRTCEYAAEDADFTWRLYEALSKQMSGHRVERLFRDVEMPLVDVLIDMEFAGIKLAPERLVALNHRLGDRMVELTGEIHRAVGRKFNIESTKQLATVLFDELGLPVIRKTKTGRSTDADTLETLAERTEHSVPPLLLEYRSLAKLRNTYVETLPRMVNSETGRLHTTYQQNGAVTGRLSSNEPNLQNIPIRTELGRQIREAFVAGDADCVLLRADYSQIELRILAHYCHDEALMDAFRQGVDIHRAVAAEVNGISLEAVTSAQRSAAKAVNFGIIYGQSAFGLSRSLGISQTEAKAFIDAYFGRYPGIRRFIDECIAEAKRTGVVETILGRRRPVPELQSANRTQAAFGERIAVNTVIQGAAADLIKRAMVDIHRELRQGAWKTRMLLQVHDELVFESPMVEVEACGEMIREKMSNALPLDVPIVVDLSTGATWADAKV